MPVYCYRRNSDGKPVDLHMSVAEKERRERADGSIMLDDGSEANRDFQAEHGSRGPRGEWPRYSDAMGVTAGQADEAYRDSVARGVPTEFCKHTGRAIFKSPSHQKRYVKAVHGVDYGAYTS